MAPASLCSPSRRRIAQTSPSSGRSCPGVVTTIAGRLVAVAPGERLLDLANWVWPALLAILVVSSFRGARRSLNSWSRRAFLYPALGALALIAVGGAVGTVMAATSSNPPPASGRTYLANSHRLYLNCVGSGSPTVVLFNGLGEWTPNWTWVQANVSATTRVCAFDRAGEGWSGGKATPEDGHQLASDLHALLRVAHVPGPYVLAGHSVGGTYAPLRRAVSAPGRRRGTDRLGDAVSVRPPDYPSFYSMWKRASALLPLAARTAIGRIELRSGFGSLPPRARDAARAFNSSPRQLTASRIEFLQLPTVFNQAKALRSLHGKPLGVLSASVGEMRGWDNAQDKLAQLSANSTHHTVAGATHAALLEDKKFAHATARAITQVVSRTRSGRR